MGPDRVAIVVGELQGMDDEPGVTLSGVSDRRRHAAGSFACGDGVQLVLFAGGRVRTADGNTEDKPHDECHPEHPST